MRDRRTGRRAVEVLADAHCVLGAVLLTQRPTVIRVITGDQGVPPPWVIRLLGARTMAQGAAASLRPRRDVLVVGVAVDLAHAASMVAAASVWPQYRRAALISAGGAAISAALGALVTAGVP